MFVHVFVFNSVQSLTEVELKRLWSSKQCELSHYLGNKKLVCFVLRFYRLSTSAADCTRDVVYLSILSKIGRQRILFFYTRINYAFPAPPSLCCRSLRGIMCIQYCNNAFKMLMRLLQHRCYSASRITHFFVYVF